MSEFFKNIGKIPYEGKNSTNPLAFKYYDPDEVIGGKTMKEQLKLRFHGGTLWAETAQICSA